MQHKLSIIAGIIGVVLLAMPPLIEHLESTTLGAGYDTGFSYDVIPSGSESKIVFNVQSSDTYYLQFKLAGLAPATTTCTANTLNAALKCAASPDDPETFEISAAPPQPVVRAKFQWNTGDSVYCLVRRPGLNKAAITRWKAIPNSHSYDSSEFVGRRLVIEWGFWLAAAVSLVSAIVAYLKTQGPPPPQTPLQLAVSNVMTLADNVVGTNAAETTMMRTYVRMRINGTPTAQALAAAGIPPSLQARLVFSARAQIRGTGKTLIGNLWTIIRAV